MKIRRCHHDVPPLTSPTFAADCAGREACCEKQGMCQHCGMWLYARWFHTRTDFIEALEYGEEVKGRMALGE